MASTDPTAPNPASDAEFLRELLARTRRRVDPHAFHFVWWGAVVFVWYPLSTWLQSRGLLGWMAGLGVAAVMLGVLGSLLLEARVRGRSRLEAEDSAVGRQVSRVVAGNVAAGGVLSAVAPATGFVAGPMVPVLWGIVYASIAFHVGITYSREFTWSSAFILAGTCASMALGADCGYALGPVMGLGLIVPGLVAERRVRSMRREDALDAAVAS